MAFGSSEKLSRKNMWGYAFGAIPTGLLGFVFTFKYIEFFFDDLALLPAYFVVGQIIYMTVNSLNDPLSGQLSDRTDRERWGSRRLIYIKYGGPVWALTFMLVWIPWSLTDQLVIFIHYVITICAFDTMYTLVILLWLALLPEMTMDIDERNKAQFFATVLGTVVVLPAFLIIANISPNSDEFRMIMLVFAVISTFFLFLTASMCEERPEFQSDEVYSLKESILATFRSNSFLVYAGFYFAQNLLGSLGLSYFFIYIMLLEVISPGLNIILLFFIIYFIVGYGGNIIAMRLRPRWGMRGVILKFGVVRVIASLALFFIILVPSLEWVIWYGLILTTLASGYGIFHIPMQYLAIDEDEVLHGSRREGMFIGVMALLTRPGTSLGPIIATFVLATLGYIQGGGVEAQPASAFLGIKILWLLVPALVAALSLVFIYYYPLHGERLAEMQEKLKELHKKKRTAFLSAKEIATELAENTDGPQMED
ncbi:MAG: MFS transporter [Candidatus Thorarchaeota archaeon]|nr:MAG: MFS transporter [Candidatus Thorarchaeota archaeon]